VKKSAFASEPRRAVDKDTWGRACGQRLSRVREANDRAASLTVAPTDKRAELNSNY
jgi:hypothetical protein